jgi:hypothetical protein
MIANDSRPSYPNQDASAHFGKAAILVPLIIGGAVIAAAIFFWHAKARRERLAEATRVEEMARRELRAAFVEMRALRPDAALERADAAKELIALLPADLDPHYAELKMTNLLIEGESLFMLDCGANAEIAGERFDEALRLMNRASGEMWENGMLGRARARFEAKQYAAAQEDLDAVMDRNDSFGAAYYWRSLTRRELGDAKGAAEDEKRARALDSWPPLRDFMQASCVWTRDIIFKPPGASEGGLMEIFEADSDRADTGAPTPEAGTAEVLQNR